MNNSLTSNLSEFPDEQKDPEFWGVLTGEPFKRVIGFLLINEVRKYNPEQLPIASCRTQLAKIKTLQELYDFPNAMIRAGEKDTGPTDELND